MSYVIYFENTDGLINCFNFRKMATIKRNLRDVSDPFNAMTDQQFIRIFRLNKSVLRIIAAKLIPHMHDGFTYHALPPIVRIFSALSFFANGIYFCIK